MKDKSELTYVKTIYGRRVRVAISDLENAKKTQLPIYNQFGRRLLDSDRNMKSGIALTLHRGNIHKETRS